MSPKLLLTKAPIATALALFAPDHRREAVEDAVATLFSRLDKEHSRRAYATDWQAYCVFLTAQSTSVLEARAKHVAAYKTLLEHDGYAPSTITRKLAVLRAFYAEFVVHGLVDKNPARDVRAPRKKGQVRHRSDTSEVQKLLAAFPQTWTGRRNRLVALYAIGTGLRRESIAALRVADFQPGKQRLIVRKAKRDKVGDLPMPGPLRDATIEWLSSTDLLDAHALFPRSELALTEAIGPSTVWRVVTEAAKRAGIPPENAAPHALRRTYARELRLRGVPLDVIRDLLLHASIRTTQAYVGSIPVTDTSGADALLKDVMKED